MKKNYEAPFIEVIIFEPELKEKIFFDSRVIHKFEEFLIESDIVVTNRFYEELESVRAKVYTRDLFNRD